MNFPGNAKCAVVLTFDFDAELMWLSYPRTPGYISRGQYGAFVGVPRVMELLKEEFGDDFYVELQVHYFPEQLTANPMLLKIMDELDVKPIITTDVHYANKEKKEVHNALKAISFNKKYGEANFTGDTHCLMSSKDLEVAALKTNITKKVFDLAAEVTLEVAEKCNGRLEKYDTVIPQFEIPEEFNG